MKNEQPIPASEAKIRVSERDICKTIEYALRCFNIPDAEMEPAINRVLRLFDQLLPGIFKSLAIADRTPEIKEKAFMKYFKSGLSHCEAEEAADKLEDKIHRMFIRNLPHGNPGALIARMLATVKIDYQRKEKRDRKTRGVTQNHVNLDCFIDPRGQVDHLVRQEVIDELNQFVLETDDDALMHIDDARNKGEWPIASPDSLTGNEEPARGKDQREWPGGPPSRSRKNRRSIKSSRR